MNSPFAPVKTIFSEDPTLLSIGDANMFWKRDDRDENRFNYGNVDHREDFERGRKRKVPPNLRCYE